MQFDGVYFQKHMENRSAGISESQRESIQKYRIYDISC